MTSLTETKDELKKRILILNDRIWEEKISWVDVEIWLNNFDGKTGLDPEIEQLNALYLLSEFMYFGNNEIRVLLKALYRDLYLIPLLNSLKNSSKGTLSDDQLLSKLEEAKAKTRFLGVGNPSESGVHLLYYLRQENELSKADFADGLQLLQRDKSDTTKWNLRDPNVEHYIFIDDLCGSGDTATAYSEGILSEIKKVKPDVKLYYFTLFGTKDGLDAVRRTSAFSNNVGAVFEFDETFNCTSPNSRYFHAMPAGIESQILINIVNTYGSLLNPIYPFGYKHAGILLGLHHNIPDNTIPIFWMDRANGARIQWSPIFKRYPKI